jgi:hypothetical protein
MSKSRNRNFYDDYEVEDLKMTTREDRRKLRKEKSKQRDRNISVEYTDEESINS